MIRIPGLALTDHTFTVPLDHGDPSRGSIEVFAREVCAIDRAGEALPWLIFFQGGPGSPSPRPSGASERWLGQALKTHRVLLLDQRGTGRSTPITGRTVAGRTDLADYLRLFRADSIVRDAELIRARLLGDGQWESLGQSYGGFVTLTYLSLAPAGLRACYVTGGLPGLSASADDVYARTYPRVAAKNAAYYARYPGDAATIRRIADELTSTDVRLPDGDRLTLDRFRYLGNAFGMGDGYERLHWLLDDGWLSDAFLYEVMTRTGFVDSPLFALQEYIYGAPGRPTRWAAQRALESRPEFAPSADPLLFTGEMMYPWMFRDIAALRPFAAAADTLAEADDWPALYDVDRLASNEVPVAAAIYFDDMYVDAGLSLETAGAVGNVRTWVTNEYEHDGGAVSRGKVLARLMDMTAGRI
ncbi:alpha/beta fold hydrolase [Asanoa sp. WMMD1127]|uniref:alpha/beta fold hydrolase n=1 Tax=Asanoa sp. WMMD1127 TaxID=3016107 RepID=UPI00241703E6|nr:alpha/beta fold hydrolase [Asanoa sp. WMMD1127]MDG4826775.1 alpha/beta fold hydrolase [Asanoa sp. WMMD1127]